MCVSQSAQLSRATIAGDSAQRACERDTLHKRDGDTANHRIKTPQISIRLGIPLKNNNWESGQGLRNPRWDIPDVLHEYADRNVLSRNSIYFREADVNPCNTRNA